MKDERERSLMDFRFIRDDNTGRTKKEIRDSVIFSIPKKEKLSWFKKLIGCCCS